MGADRGKAWVEGGVRSITLPEELGKDFPKAQDDVSTDEIAPSELH